WDHAYAVTTYFAQGQTHDKIIALLESHQIRLMNQKHLLVALSRAVEQATLITDDVNRLLEGILKNTGEKTSALEVLGEIQRPQLASPTALATASAKEMKPLKNNTIIPRSEEKTLYWQSHTIAEKLTSNIETILPHILGKPKAKSQQQY